MDEDFLKIGDHICLYSDTANGYLTSMGFNSPEIYIQQCSQLHNSHFYNLRNMVFEVVPKLSYDAMKEMRRENKMIKQKEENPDEVAEPVDPELFETRKKRMDTLEKRVKKNNENNLKYMADVHGRKVLYGQQIQLRHVDSGYFIQHSKKMSQFDRQCQQMELIKDPSPQRASFQVLPRYKYRQDGEPVVYNDHIILYNHKYNVYIHVSEDTIFDQEVREPMPSEYRPPSPKRKPNPDEVYKRLEANTSQNYYKWQVVYYRHIKTEKERDKFIFSGDVIILKHAETNGCLCHDDQSAKRQGDPAYVRIYKGSDENDVITTNNLFEIEVHIQDYSETVSEQGSYLTWRNQKKNSNLTQLVRFRHLNSGKLLTVVPQKSSKEDMPKSSRGGRKDIESAKQQEKLILTLGDNISADEMNRRVSQINRIEHENKFNLDFNPKTDPRILKMNQSVGFDQVFEIENTIIETAPKIKNHSVVKIKNILYNQYISTEIKKLDGETEEQDPEAGSQGGNDQLVNQTADIGGGGFADETQTQIGGQPGDQSSYVIDNLGDQTTSNIGGQSNLEGQDKSQVLEGEEEEEGEEETMNGKFAQIMVDESDNIIVNSTKMIHNGSMDDVFILEKFNGEEVRKILFVASCVPKIKEFVYSLRRSTEQLNSPYMKGFEELLTKMVFFVTRTDNKDPFNCEGIPFKQVQKYLRELKVIDLLMDILIYPFEGEPLIYELSKLTQRSPIVRICQLIYRLLKHCAKDNELNKFYVAQWISHFFDQSMVTSEENNLQAESTITELLTDNKPLLDKQINTTTIRKIIQNCASNKKNERSLNLLSALCQCNGEAIASNQDDICEMLLEEEEFKSLLIPVEKIGGQWMATIDDEEVVENNGGKPLKISIENMEKYFKEKDNMRMYNYFDSMINLISLMCLQRNYKGINVLAGNYTIDFAIDCFLNTKISYKMRSNFAKMLISLHIDKDPLEKINVPILTRVWQEIVQPKDQAGIPTSREKIHPKLIKLKDFSINYFEQMNGIQRSYYVEQNMLTLQVLIIVEKMVMLGFYTNEKEILLIMEPIIALLDGSNDFISEEEEKAFLVAQQQAQEASNSQNPKKKQAPILITRDKQARYKNSETNKAIIEIKQKIIDILHKIMDMQNDIRLTKLLQEFNKSEQEMRTDPARSTVELKYLQEVLNGGQDFIENKKSVDEKVLNWMKISYMNKNLDMKYTSTKRDLVCILLDIILYQDSHLVNSAFTLLTRYFEQKKSIIKYANEVQLLQDQQEVAILKKVSGDLRDMKKEAENSEFWMGLPEQTTLKKARQFIDKLEILTDLCIFRPNRVIDIDDKKKKNEDLGDDDDGDADELEFHNLTELKAEWDNEDPKVCTDEEVNDEKNQRLLRNLRAHEIPIIIIRQQALDQAEDKNSYLKVLEKAYIFLIKFVRNNKENQFILINYIDLFVEDMEYGVHSWELISEIYKNSELLLSHAYTPLLKKVIKLIDSLPKETQKKTTMLSFLTYFMRYNGNSLKEAQYAICVEVTSIIRKNCDHLFVGEVGLKDLHLYILEMKNAYSEFMNDDRYVQEIQIPPELSYTIEYIKLLANCGEGKNATTETRCQEKLPVEDILENMHLADFCFPLKSALVYFMDSIYFDIEKDVTDENIQKMYDFLQIIAADLERFIEIQQRNNQNRGQPKGKGNKRQNEGQQEEGDLDEIKVDINKNFSMLTSFGSFPILYLIERYIFENVYQALTHYFDLRLPIKPKQKEFFRKFLNLIQRATNFVSKEFHKDKARDLFKVIKKIPQLKDLGGDSLHNKALQDPSGKGDKKQQGNFQQIPQMSQAQKLTSYLKSVSTNDDLQSEFESEFEGLVVYVTQIHMKTNEAFNGTNTLDVKEVINALINISDIKSDIDKPLRIVCLKVIRKVVELENKKKQTPALEWESDDWQMYSNEIKEQQAMLIKLGVVKLICNLISFEQKLSIKEEALLVSVAILLGGNNTSQNRFNTYIREDERNAFMSSLKKMLNDSWDVIKRTQEKRNTAKEKQIQAKKRVDEVNDLLQMKESHSAHQRKKLNEDSKKQNLELKLIEEDLKETEFDRDENPAMYTTDELTVARALNDFRLCLKLHQLFCENHNLTLQNTLRQQLNEDGKLKNNSIDFPTLYAKMLEQFHKIFNRNTSDVGHQLVETLTESIQGPCKLNQKALVNAKILDSSREYIAGFDKSEVGKLEMDGDDEMDSLNEFKQKIVTLLTSLLEGEIDMDIMQRMAFSLDFNVMKERMLIVFTLFSEEMMKEEVDVNQIGLNKLNNRLQKNSFDGNVGEAFEIFILMHSLADCIPESKSNLERTQFSPEQWKAFEFIRQHMGRIEIVANGNLQRIYFPIRPVCHFMSPGAKKDLMNNVDRESQATKVSGLMAAVPDLIDEMNHNEELSQAFLQITPKRLMLLKDFSTMIGLLINFVYLVFARRKYHYREIDIEDWVVDVIEILGYIQGASSGILIFFYAINKKRLITQKMWRDYISDNKEKYKVMPNNDRLDVTEMSFEMTHLILLVKGPDAPEFNIDPDHINFGNHFTTSEYHLFNIFFFIQDGTFQYYVLYFGISILGYISQDIYYSFHLLDVVNRIPTLQNVIKSVTQNFEQLSLTVLLLMIIVYIFTSLTFFYIQVNMYDWEVNAYDSDIVGENNCLTMFQCYVTMLDKGLRFGGGIGDITEPIHFGNMNETYYVKLVHDACFHIIVKVILLNVLFGIIIDTFAQLRDEKSKIDNDMINVCFICNHSRLMFDKYSEGGFDRHIEKDHNLWNYVFYMVHLHSKDTSDHTGIESHILHKFDDKDTSWIPRQRAMCLQSRLDDEDDDQADEETRIMLKEWQKSILQVEKQLIDLMENIKKKEDEELELKQRKIKEKEKNNLSVSQK